MKLIKVGVIGCKGDLGSKLSAQLMSRSIHVIGYDVNRSITPSKLAVDESLNLEKSCEITIVESAEELFEKCDVVHWCAPIKEVETIVENMQRNTFLLLHDSVMNNSVIAKKKLEKAFYKPVSIVHFLMNSSNMVVIAKESDDVEGTEKHIASLGLNSTVMSAKEHDKNMAHSQAPFAVLHEMLATELERLASLGLLTPSGEAMSEALLDRSAQWTEATFKTLLSNPELPKLLDSMKDMLKVKNDER